jgi:hypothetical protein
MKPGGLGPAALFLLLEPAFAGAAEPDASSCLDALLEVRPRASIVLAAGGASLRGEFLRVDEERAEVWLRTFDAGASRYGRAAVQVSEIQGVTLVETHKSAGYAVAGALGLAGLGATLVLGLPADDFSEDDRAGLAFAVGGIALILGGTAGAMIAPEHTVSRELDCGP